MFAGVSRRASRLVRARCESRRHRHKRNKYLKSQMGRAETAGLGEFLWRDGYLSAGVAHGLVRFAFGQDANAAIFLDKHDLKRPGGLELPRIVGNLPISH
jgi:hypothetical protein